MCVYLFIYLIVSCGVIYVCTHVCIYVSTFCLKWMHTLEIANSWGHWNNLFSFCISYLPLMLFIIRIFFSPVSHNAGYLVLSRIDSCRHNRPSLNGTSIWCKAERQQFWGKGGKFFTSNSVYERYSVLLILQLWKGNLTSMHVIQMIKLGSMHNIRENQFLYPSASHFHTLSDYSLTLLLLLKLGWEQ